MVCVCVCGADLPSPSPHSTNRQWNATFKTNNHVIVNDKISIEVCAHHLHSSPRFIPPPSIWVDTYSICCPALPLFCFSFCSQCERNHNGNESAYIRVAEIQRCISHYFNESVSLWYVTFGFWPTIPPIMPHTYTLQIIYWAFFDRKIN